jgi:hypothetical protein
VLVLVLAAVREEGVRADAAMPTQQQTATWMSRRARVYHSHDIRPIVRQQPLRSSG